jgi:hypothetical protein
MVPLITLSFINYNKMLIRDMEMEMAILGELNFLMI